MSEPTLAGQFCAHLHVEWHTSDDGNITVGWWECAVCPQHFVPFTEDLIRTVAALTAENAQLRETLTLGLGEQESVIAGLRAENERLTGLLAPFVDDEPCRFDHHGNCQSHYVTNPCIVAAARAALPSSRETTDG